MACVGAELRLASPRQFDQGLRRSPVEFKEKRACEVANDLRNIIMKRPPIKQRHVENESV
jgi:hypothetical protein